MTVVHGAKALVLVAIVSYGAAVIVRETYRGPKIGGHLQRRRAQLPNWSRRALAIKVLRIGFMLGGMGR
jgi:hypothetical protein